MSVDNTTNYIMMLFIVHFYPLCLKSFVAVLKSFLITDFKLLFIKKPTLSTFVTVTNEVNEYPKILVFDNKS